MATNFPASLDTLTNPSATDTLDSPPHDEQHADANDAIEALQAKVGVDGSAVTTSLDYKVANLESRPVETKTASYVLVAADVNKRIVMNNAGATTITVNDAVFAAGDVVWLHNIGAGTCTVTAGTATVNTAASLDLAQWEGGSLYFTSASSAIFFRGGGAGVANANFTDTETGTYSSGGTNYKYLTFTASGTITFDTDGLATLLVVGGGAGGGGSVGGAGVPGGGGGGGQVLEDDFYFTAGTYTVTVGAGGAAGQSGAGFGQPSHGKNGNASLVGNYMAAGGGGGGPRTTNAARDRGYDGASGGGGGLSGVGGSAYSTLTGNDGASSGGGGGGAGGTPSGSTGGVGESSSITNTPVTYGAGGDGNQDPCVAGGANTGDGGEGVQDENNQPSAGGSGIVVVRVET